jgi:hypothetical protein
MYRYGPPCPTLLRPVGGHPCNGLTAVSWVVARKVSGLRLSSTPLNTPHSVHLYFLPLKEHHLVVSQRVVVRRQLQPIPRKVEKDEIRAKGVPFTGFAIPLDFDTSTLPCALRYGHRKIMVELFLPKNLSLIAQTVWKWRIFEVRENFRHLHMLCVMRLEFSGTIRSTMIFLMV